VEPDSDVEVGSMEDITVVGGGLAGLAASIACAEGGAAVRLVEAHAQLGGRARSTAGDYKANYGPHVLYSDGPVWDFLAERDILPPFANPPMKGFRLRHEGELRRTPPMALLQPLLHRKTTAPVDASFRDWATDRWGADSAALLSSAAGVFSFDADPGCLSAAFVWERLLRVTSVPPAARYVIGGWTAIVDALESHARSLGVRIETGTVLDAAPDAPVIVATELAAARRLLGDETLRWEGARTALLDVGLRARRGDPFLVSDLDECGWVENFSIPDPSLAPEGHSLLQAQMGLREDESLDQGVARIETLLDVGYTGWRERETWRRRAVIDGRSGALVLPGTTWRDRPAIDRGDGVFLAGDMVAAPGLLGEVSVNSALEAARLALAYAGSTTTAARARPVTARS
jgi:phytoene dehydrogenase-like protein